jgi:hypothetical protein
MPPSLNVIHRGEDLGIAELGATSIAIWRSKPTRPSFELQRAELAKVVARAPGEATFLCVVEAECEPPEGFVRMASSQMITAHGRNLRKVACVIEGHGFMAAITRSVLSGMQLITRSPADIKFFRTVFEGARWLNGDASQPRVLAQSVEALREQLPARSRRMAAGAP